MKRLNHLDPNDVQSEIYEKRRQAEAAGKMVLPSLRSPEFERFMREAKEALSEDGAAPFSRGERKRR